MFKFIIDKEDITKCEEYNWELCKSHRNVEGKNWGTYYYAYSSKTKKHPKQILLHRLVTDCPKGFDVDHIDKNTYNNRKSNLRICTRSENLCNRKMQINNSSGVVGVTWSKKDNKWMAYIMLHKKFINLGYFTDINKAAKVRKQVEQKYFGEFKPDNIT